MKNEKLFIKGILLLIVISSASIILIKVIPIPKAIGFIALFILCLSLICLIIHFINTIIKALTIYIKKNS